MGRLSSKTKLESEISAHESRINKEKLKNDKLKILIEKLNNQINTMNNNHDAFGLFLFDSCNQKTIYDGTDLFVNENCTQTDPEIPKIFASTDEHYYDVLRNEEKTSKKNTLNSIFTKHTSTAIANNKIKLSPTSALPTQQDVISLQGLSKIIDGDNMIVAEEMEINCDTPSILY